MKKLKILTLSGTRPEIIKKSIIVRRLDDHPYVDHIWVYSNQNFDQNLRDIFLEDLELRQPDYTFKEVGYKGFLPNAFAEFDEILQQERPDKVLMLGDTNTGLLTILAKKRNIPVYHMEGGLRSYDPLLPEETNRRIIDLVSTYNLTHTENGKENLLKEGYDKNHVFNVGNPIYEVLDYYSNEINESDILFRLGLEPGEGGAMASYVLVTFHRANNVDDAYRATNVVLALNEIAKSVKVIVSYHPRTADQFKQHGLIFGENVMVLPAMGFFDFVKLEQNAKCVISDSGTVPEECSIFHVPSVVIRDCVERQELVEAGSIIVSGLDKDEIIRSYYTATTMETDWQMPHDYIRLNVSDTVIKILVGKV